jgi:hypothetical protein
MAAPAAKEKVTMAGIFDSPEGYGLDTPANEQFARQQAISQIEFRRFMVSAAWFSIGMVILTAILAAAKYHNAASWPVPGIHEVWNSWIVYPLGAGLLILTVRGWFVFGNKPTSESEIRREIERRTSLRR